MASAGSGHIERLPSGSLRVSVFAGRDPLTGRQLWHRKTVGTEKEAQIALGRLLEQADSGRRPDSRVTVGELIARYMEVVEVDLSTRRTYEGYIRRTILPALGSVEVRKVRGPVLDTFYTRLRRCGNLPCSGRPFTEHVWLPPLTVAPGRRPVWQQVADQIREAVRSGQLRPGDRLLSAREMADLHGLQPDTVQHAMAALADDRLIEVCQGRRAVVNGHGVNPAPRLRRLPADHDCAHSGCPAHQCKPMAPASIRQIHAILSGAFKAAMRWEWIDRNPAASAALPKAQVRPPSSPAPDTVAKVITTAQDLGLDLLAVYLWLAAITGARRGELCGLQWADLDLDGGVVHIAHSYLELPGVKLRKDTKTHQNRQLAIDEVTVAVLAEHQQSVRDQLGRAGVELPAGAYVFSHDPSGEAPWNPSWVTNRVAEVSKAAAVALNIKSLRHYSATQLLAGGIDLRNTAARLGHGGGGATTLRHYADPVSEVDRRAAAYLAQLTTKPALPPTDSSAPAPTSAFSPATRNS